MIIYRHRVHLSAVSAVFALCACAANSVATDPLKATYDGCTATRAAVQATDAAVLAGRLSKPDAQKAYVGFVAMQAGCNAAVAALKASVPASGASAP